MRFETTAPHRARSSVAVAALALLGLAGCGSTQSASATGSASSLPSGSTGAATTAATTAAASTGTELSQPSTALAAWVANVIQGRFSDACTEMVAVGSPAPSGGASASPSAPSQTSCANLDKPIADGQSLQSLLARFKPLFAPGTGTATSGTSSTSGTPDVKVTPVTATGQTVTIDARQITIDGQSLDKIVVAHSTGVTADQFDLSFPMDQIAGSWYVGDFNLNLG